MWKAANVARVGRASLACLAGSALIILPVSFAGAVYGPRITIGNNYQQHSNTMSANGVSESGCNGTVCFVLFQLPPQQRPLIIQQVACLANVTNDLRYAILWNRKGQEFPPTLTYVLPVHTTDNSWVVDRPVMHLVKSGERPTVRFTSNALSVWSDLSCTISGKLQQP